MYSAGDSSGDGLNSLNHLSNMNGPIDWAAMAQQWIQMHDTGNFTPMPDAPPPPSISSAFDQGSAVTNISTNTTTTKKKFEEKGEADMDMDEDDENGRCTDTPPPPAPSMHPGRPREQSIQSQAPWYMQQQNQGGVTPTPGSFLSMDASDSVGPSIPAAPQWNANIWPPRMNLPPPSAPILNVPLNGPVANTTAHIPSLMKINVPNPNAVRLLTPNAEEQNATTTTVDARKRKMLPAWIREGLEKMEREKQKQMEREQRKQQREEGGIEFSNFTESVGTADDTTHTVNMNNKLTLENDRSGNEDEVDAEDLDGVAINDDAITLRQKTANDGDASGVSGPEYETDIDDAEQDNYTGKRGYEERLTDLMIVVRTTLTELLLDVTNQEIANLAQEAVNVHKAKASSAQVIRKSALSSITGKLGLAAYDDSSGDESSASENEATTDYDPNNDSEEEIKASIRVKRRTFAKISDEIEERIAATAAREEQKLKYYTQLEKQEQEEDQYGDVATGECVKRDRKLNAMRSSAYTTKSGATSSTASSAGTSAVSKAYERDFGETTETKLQHSNGKRQKERNSRKERTTRFSDNKDSKGAAAAAATYISQMHSTNANLSGNTIGNALFSAAGTTSTTSLTIGGTAAIASSSSATVTSLDATQIVYGIASIADDSTGVSVLNKNLLNAAEAAFEKATKSHHVSGSRSSASRSERERSHRSYHDREHKQNRDGEKKRRHGRREHKPQHSSDDDETTDEKAVQRESQSTSSDTDTSSTSASTTTTSTSQHSSHYSRTSNMSKQRRESRRRDDERGHSSSGARKSVRSRSRSHSHIRSRHHHHRSGGRRHSSADDEHDDDSYHRHSSSRHSSSRHSSMRHSTSRRRSRSRSRSTYSSSSRWRRY